MAEGIQIFDFQAMAGITKMMGGPDATNELARLCRITDRSHVLDVGCGVGATPCYLAREYGCRVTGVDIRSKMIERSIERARYEGVQDRVQFRLADAQHLPFEDGSFDAVISESVLAMVPDKPRAVAEYARVARGSAQPGEGPDAAVDSGYVGVNEGTWLKTPPPQEVLDWVGQDLNWGAELLSEEGWVGLLQGAGLREVTSRTYPVDLKGEFASTVRRYGWRNLLRIWARSLLMYFRLPESRRVLTAAGSAPKGLLEYYGYGIYVGRKA